MNRIYIKTWGGIGDIVLGTPIFQELKKINPESKIIVVCVEKRHFPILQNNPFIDVLCNLSFRGYYYLAMEYFGKIKFYNMDYLRLGSSLLYKKKASEIIAEIFNIQLSDTKLQIFLTPLEESIAQNTLKEIKNPVILQITGACSENKNWRVENWSELVKSTPEYTFIQLGSAKEPLVEGTIDLRGKTTTRESMALVKYALGFAGIDSFMAHVTNAFDVPGIVLFGPSVIEVWGHKNNLNIRKNLPCSPCIDILHGVKCPYNHPCMTHITVKEVQEAIYKHIPITKSKNINNITTSITSSVEEYPM